MSELLPTPAERLTLSRDRLRLALRDIAGPAGHTADARTSGAKLAWLDGLKSMPVAGIVLEAVRSWWAQHPWRVATLLAGETVKTVVQPLAQRHPIGLVVGAVLVGGVLAWARPWRLVFTSSLLAGLLPQLLSKAVTQIPIKSWMTVLTELLKQPQPTQEPAQTAGFSTARADIPTH
ncbi:MAG: hypothetical protein KJ614_13400 [Gammaproteobacteria bacterium]|uniref:hypothetical protein n=1 Tax=Rhodoferax sp. TaxID=50421 RepID=UPI00181C5C70|nr:hypothetical protein [Rhodoferax sp.]MBU3899896.1 hypothetical protein [Gammaproteobacteria bacterium]MBA3057853.1 hypothetical protein [Rhodoferax sp.]MBU3996080.1 hypothetical protein [Gammaproteobacteria bacterium]MBU4019162.1 hypothetical protein [Gammaproteobacteria bacterium]MBU4078880.1 hypothetical protein [Gammaproteobacteria bacterium]